MQVLINGAAHSVHDACTVRDLVTLLALPEKGIAIAVADAVVPRGRWSERTLLPDERIEILTAVQGG